MNCMDQIIRAVRCGTRLDEREPRARDTAIVIPEDNRSDGFKKMR